MLKAIISLVFSILLVVSPIVGQLIHQNMTLPAQQAFTSNDSDYTNDYSLVNDHNSDTVNQTSENYSLVRGINPVTEGSETSTFQETASPIKEEPSSNEDDNNQNQDPQLEPVIEPSAKPAYTPATRTASEPKESPKTRNNSSSQQEKAQEQIITPRPGTTVKPTESPKATEKPKLTEAPKSTVKPTEAPKATEKPKETPKPTSTPKPAEESSSKPKDSTLSSDDVFDTSKLSSGKIGVRYLNTSGKKVKLMIEKGETRYTYNLAGDGSLETFPLQSGDGEYTVSIMQNTEGNKYVYVLTKAISVKLSNSNSLYLGSIQMINWNKNMAAIKKAAELTSGISDDEAKVKKIYNYVVKNVSYDYDKLNNLPSTYIPVIDNTYKSKSGICYDFASLTAAMLRSVGIPAKLVMGYADGIDGYHAWNEVYYNGKWVVIDTSYDSQLRENGISYSMVKSKSNYHAKKAY